MGERLLHGPQLLGHDPPHHGLELADLDAFWLGWLRLRLERLEQGPLDPRADRHPGLVGRRHRGLAHLVTDAADRPTPGQTGSSRPRDGAATLKARPRPGNGVVPEFAVRGHISTCEVASAP